MDPTCFPDGELLTCNYQNSVTWCSAVSWPDIRNHFFCTGFLLTQLYVLCVLYVQCAQYVHYAQYVLYVLHVLHVQCSLYVQYLQYVLLCQRLVPAVAIGLQLREGFDQRIFSFFTVSLLLLRQRLVPAVAIGLQLREGLDQRGITWDTMYVWDSLGKQWMFGNPWCNNGCLGILGKQWMFGNPWGINGCVGRAGETRNNVL